MLIELGRTYETFRGNAKVVATHKDNVPEFTTHTVEIEGIGRYKVNYRGLALKGSAFHLLTEKRSTPVVSPVTIEVENPVQQSRFVRLLNHLRGR